MNTTRCIFVCAIVVAIQGLIWATLQLREMHAGINVETKIMHRKSAMGFKGAIHDLRDHGQQDRAQNRRQTPFTEKPNVPKTSIRTRSPITTQTASNITRSPTVAAGTEIRHNVVGGPMPSRYHIVDLKNPETKPCPTRLTMFAPELKGETCRGDINMIWAVATYKSIGADPLQYEKATVLSPVQTAADIRPRKRSRVNRMIDHKRSNTDVAALFVADPFLVPYFYDSQRNIVLERAKGTTRQAASWVMFTEILDANDQKGKIGVHVSHDNLATFSFKGIVIEEPWHLSFPYVVPYKNEFYMTTSGTSGIESEPYFLWLYKAAKYPYTWERFKLILDGQTGSAPVDPAIVSHNGVYYLFTRDMSMNEGEGMERLFYNKNGLYEEFTLSIQ